MVQCIPTEIIHIKKRKKILKQARIYLPKGKITPSNAGYHGNIQERKQQKNCLFHSLLYVTMVTWGIDIRAEMGCNASLEVFYVKYMVLYTK